ncbi:MAG: hypothetical protein Q8L88_04440 [Bacteroidota bacterium]|nr:hypothetical protein [Bacteroidota bacterium]
MNNTQKNIVVVSLALAFVGTTYYFIYRHDEELLTNYSRWGKMSETPVNHSTAEEIRVALQFSDSTLPQLQQLGLIKSFTRTEIETIVTVSGAIWNERSAFFKKSLLEQIFIYNKVNGYSVKTKIIDEQTSELYAEITPPDRRAVY